MGLTRRFSKRTQYALSYGSSMATPRTLLHTTTDDETLRRMAALEEGAYGKPSLPDKKFDILF